MKLNKKLSHPMDKNNRPEMKAIVLGIILISF